MSGFATAQVTVGVTLRTWINVPNGPRLDYSGFIAEPGFRIGWGINMCRFFLRIYHLDRL
jgi:hypothetical protein